MRFHHAVRHLLLLLKVWLLVVRSAVGWFKEAITLKPMEVEFSITMIGALGLPEEYKWFADSILHSSYLLSHSYLIKTDTITCMFIFPTGKKNFWNKLGIHKDKPGKNKELTNMKTPQWHWTLTNELNMGFQFSNKPINLKNQHPFIVTVPSVTFATLLQNAQNCYLGNTQSKVMNSIILQKSIIWQRK